MNELFRELVRQRLSAAKDCPAKADIVEEITADLTEKYNEDRKSVGRERVC